MRPLRGVVRRLGSRPWFAGALSRILPPLDRFVHRLTGGRAVVAAAAAPTLLLTIGDRKPVPLLYATDGSDLVVAATNWGKPHHPAWSARLLQSGSARVTLGRRRIEVEARHLGPDERAAVWPALLEVYPAFEAYRERSGRDIRVFRLVPR